MLNSPQVIWKLILNIKCFIYKLRHELANDQKLGISGNYQMLEEFQVWVGIQGSVFVLQVIDRKKQSKSMQKSISKFSIPVQSLLISLHCSKCFVQGYTKSLLSHVYPPYVIFCLHFLLDFWKTFVFYNIFSSAGNLRIFWFNLNKH